MKNIRFNIFDVDFWSFLTGIADLSLFFGLSGKEVSRYH